MTDPMLAEPPPTAAELAEGMVVAEIIQATMQVGMLSPERAARRLAEIADMIHSTLRAGMPPAVCRPLFVTAAAICLRAAARS